MDRQIAKPLLNLSRNLTGFVEDTNWGEVGAACLAGGATGAVVGGVVGSGAMGVGAAPGAALGFMTGCGVAVGADLLDQANQHQVADLIAQADAWYTSWEFWYWVYYG